MRFTARKARLRTKYPPFFGKYRGKVLDNEDPLFLGRIQAEVAALPEIMLNWCMPCSPYAGPGVGFYAIPPIGANVWIEFEGGNINFPIWVGCFWGEGEVPIVTEEPPNPFIKTLKTDWLTLTMNDTPEVGGITLKCMPPAVTIPLSMTFDSLGITITAPPATIKMISEEGITLSFPPGVIAMTEPGVEIAVPASTVTVTEEAIILASPTIEGTAEGPLSLTGGADVSISAGGVLDVQAGLEASVTAGAAIEITADADVMITGAIVLIN